MYLLVCVCVWTWSASQPSVVKLHSPDTRPPTRSRTFAGTRTPTLALPLSHSMSVPVSPHVLHAHTHNRERHCTCTCFFAFASAFALLANCTLLLLLLLLLSDWTLYCCCPENGRYVCICFSAFYLAYDCCCTPFSLSLTLLLSHKKRSKKRSRRQCQSANCEGIACALSRSIALPLLPAWLWGYLSLSLSLF